MKKALFLIGSIFFGYVGLTGFAFVINPSTQDMPSSFLTVMGIIGAIGLFFMRFFWKKFREPKQIKNMEKN